MPIYVFKCSKCSEFFELLVMNGDEQVEVGCPKCKSGEFERVMSATNYSMGAAASGGGGGVSAKTRTCSGGSCTTYDIPGPG